jgi:hypothetical protein
MNKKKCDFYTTYIKSYMSLWNKIIELYPTIYKRKWDEISIKTNNSSKLMMSFLLRNNE